MSTCPLSKPLSGDKLSDSSSCLSIFFDCDWLLCQNQPSSFSADRFNTLCKFSFEDKSFVDVKKITQGLDITKTSLPSDISTKTIR